jgi:hypothetical protein
MAYPQTYTLPATASSGTIYLSSYFDTTKDVVVSFDYACYGPAVSGTEGFCVSFVNSYVNTVTGGGPGQGLGYTPTYGLSALSGTRLLSSFAGLNYAELGVGFDITGYFAASASSSGTLDPVGTSTTTTLSGLNAKSQNSISIRDSYKNNYALIYNTPNLSTFGTPFFLYQQITDSSQALTYNRVRVRLTDFGKRVVVDMKRPSDLYFTTLADVTNNNTWPASVIGCLSFCTSLSTSPTYFKVKNFSINGSITTTKGSSTL